MQPLEVNLARINVGGFALETLTMFMVSVGCHPICLSYKVSDARGW